MVDDLFFRRCFLIMIISVFRPVGQNLSGVLLKEVRGFKPLFIFSFIDYIQCDVFRGDIVPCHPFLTLLFSKKKKTNVDNN